MSQQSAHSTTYARLCSPSPSRVMTPNRNVEMNVFSLKHDHLTSKSREEFVNNGINYSLLSVPGIGDAAEDKLKKHGINNTFQLLAKFLSFKLSSNQKPGELCNLMYSWLASIGINSDRATIVAVLAEKLSICIPGSIDFSHLISLSASDSVPVDNGSNVVAQSPIRPNVASSPLRFE